VKEDGAAFRRGGKRRRHDDIEAEEAGALDDAGSGSSPRAAPVFAVNGVPSDSLRFLSPHSTFSPPFSFSGGGVDRGGFSPEAARVGRTQETAVQLLIAVGAWGTWAAKMKQRC
jgi:hypothetical protein